MSQFIYQKNDDQLTCAPNIHKHYLEGCPGFYFIVRKDLYCGDPQCERVCLYREGMMNEHLKGNKDSFDLWISNELRNNRKLDTIHFDMHQKIVTLIIQRKFL